MLAYYAVLDLVAVAVLAQRARVGGVDRRPVVGVHVLEECLVGGAELLWRKAEDAVDLVGPGQAAAARSSSQLPRWASSWDRSSIARLAPSLSSSSSRSSSLHLRSSMSRR